MFYNDRFFKRARRMIKTEDVEDSTLKTCQHSRGSLLVHASIDFVLYRVLYLEC
ncbi:hypothetical protein HanPI659440_Chr11g0439481 [Helianthus annuus]|nr:hypothetical protein HanPI659440_Chr11g0439481 [Helianthus annuus]